jgi:hypothetical protein
MSELGEGNMPQNNERGNVQQPANQADQAIQESIALAESLRSMGAAKTAERTLRNTGVKVTPENLSTARNGFFDNFEGVVDNILPDSVS